MPAYVVVWTDYGVDPPVAIKAGIYSEKEPSCTLQVLPHCVLEVGGNDEPFAVCKAKAEARVAELAKDQPMFQWIEQQLEESIF